MSRDSWQAVRAVFLAAIMVISVFAGGIAFSGSAAAALTGVNDIEAEDVSSGEAVSQTVTLENVTGDDAGIPGQEIVIDLENNADVSILGASIENYGGLNQTDTLLFSAQDGDGRIGVVLGSEGAVDTDLTLDVTLNTSGASGSATYNVTTFDTDSPGPSTSFSIADDSTAGELGIKHASDSLLGPSVSFGSDPIFVAETLQVRPSGAETVQFGGDSPYALEIENSTGSTVRIEPENSEPTVDAAVLQTFIYSGDGSISSEPRVIVDTDTSKFGVNSTGIDVTVTGDTEMFAAGLSDGPDSDPFEEYSISLVNSSDDLTLDSTEPRLIGIGYNLSSGIQQNSTAGDVQFTIPRASENSGFNESWSAQFSIFADGFEAVTAANEPDADTFQVTSNVDDVEAGTFTPRFTLYQTGTPSDDDSDRIITIFDPISQVTIESTDTTPTPTVDARASSLSPAQVTAGETQEYTVELTINDVPNEAATVDIGVDNFTILNESGGSVDDAKVEYTADDVTDGTATFTATFNATAPNNSSASGDVSVDAVRPESSNDDIYNNQQIIDSILVQERLTVGDDDDADFETIQNAIDNANPGDIIAVSGTFRNSITIDKPITLTAEKLGTRVATPVINVSGSQSQDPAVAIEAVDVTVEGFEIVGDDSTTSGISILTSNGANTDIRIKNNKIRGMAAPGGGGPGDFSFGILSFSSSNDDGATLSGVNVTGNTIENIGSQGETQGVAISLEELNGTNPGDGALVENNEINDIATRNQDRPGTGIAIQPDDGSSSGAGDAAARVVGNEFSNTQIRVTHPVGDDTVEVPDQTQTVVEDGQVVFTDSGDIVVDADNGDGDFSSIQNAVDAAAPGSTIVVRPGEYQGPVQVVDGQTNLTIRSTGGPQSTVINATDGSARSTPSFDAQAVRISVDGVTIDGFNIVGDDTIVSGVFVAGRNGGGDNVRVVNNIIQGMSRPGFGGPSDNSAGIVTSSAGFRNEDLSRDERVVNGFVARDNTIKNIGSTAKKPNNPGDGTRAQGISLIDIAGDTAGDGAVIENNTISGLAGQDTTRGIAVQPLDRPIKNGPNLAPGVDVQDNDVSGADVGLSLGDSGGLNIADNEFSNNDVSVEDGSEAVDLDTVLQDNTFDRAVTIEDDAGNITGSSIFGAIQPAVDNAETGQVVEADPGTYDESVDISTRNVTLLGPNGGTTGDASRGDEAIIEQGLKINASEVTVDGLQIENNGTNGVRIGPEIVPDDVIIQHNRITNVEGGSFLRDGADTGAGNGIQIQFGVPEPNGETAQNIRIVDNEISDISTRDVGEIEGENGGTLAIGINVLPRGNDIRGLQIENNTIRSIEPGVPGEGDETETRAISVDTQLDDPGRGSASLNAAGQVSELRVTNNTFTDLTAGDGVAAITLFEDGRVSPRTGVENFEIRNNEFSRFDANDEVAVFIGGYEDLGRHDISLNNFSDGNIIRFDGDQSGYDVSEADTLDARLNFYNGRLSNDSITITGIGENSRGSDAVLYDPVLTVEPSERADNVENIRNYGSYIEVESDGEPTVIGFPAPPAEPLGELIPNETLQLGGDGEGAQIFLYDNAEQSFKEVNGDFVPEAGDVIVITTGGDPISGELIVPVDTELENVAGAPSQVQINEGWNLVATGAADQLRDPTATSEILAAAQFQTQPAQPGGPGATVSAYDGTWLFVADDGQLATGYVENQPPFGYSELVVLPNTEADDNDS